MEKISLLKTFDVSDLQSRIAKVKSKEIQKANTKEKAIKKNEEKEEVNTFKVNAGKMNTRSSKK